MKRLIVYFSMCFVLFMGLQLNVNASNIPTNLSADGIILMDGTTGKILYSKNQNNSYPPASTTKILTALLTFENCNLDDSVLVSKNASTQEGSSIGLKPDEKVTVRDLLYGLLLQSGNDCAMALAEHISGSCENFANLMNKKALELGCTNSHFVNPSGLYNKNHVSSAKDLALIMKELVNNHKEYSEIATKLLYKMPTTNKCSNIRSIWNKNKLVQKNSYNYKWCEGGKTGYTVVSQHSYVASAKKNNQRLIVAIVHDKNNTYCKDTKTLFEYGFNNFDLIKIYSKNSLVTTYKIDDNTTIPLLSGKDFYYVKNKNEIFTNTIDVENKDLTNRSFQKGDPILKGTIIVNNNSIGDLELLSGANYTSKTLTHSIYSSFINNKITYILGLLGGIASLFLFMKIFNNHKKSKTC